MKSPSPKEPLAVLATRQRHTLKSYERPSGVVSFMTKLYLKGTFLWLENSIVYLYPFV